MKERRESKRIRVEDEVTIVVDCEDPFSPARKICHAMTRDISLQGLRMRCSELIPAESSLKLQVSFRHPRRAIGVYGKVRWIKKVPGQELYEIGVRFTELSTENSRILKEIIRGATE
jgi:c-di-GMP-binding flagellar brake protein YcgR